MKRLSSILVVQLLCTINQCQDWRRFKINKYLVGVVVVIARFIVGRGQKLLCVRFGDK